MCLLVAQVLLLKVNIVTVAAPVHFDERQENSKLRK